MPTRQLCIIATTTYVSGVCYASCFPSLAPFLAHLEVQPAQPGATSPMLGLAVALFSIAKVLAAPSVGRWTSHIGVRLSLICCMLLLLLKATLFVCSECCVGAQSRVVLGLASCSSTPCRTWVASSGSTSQTAPADGGPLVCLPQFISGLSSEVCYFYPETTSSAFVGQAASAPCSA